MAALNETLSTGTSQSASFTPSEALSDVLVSNNGGGKITLKAKIPLGEWVKVTDQTGAFNVNTPDTAIVYAFFGVNLQETVNVYMGP